uniref:Jumonji helical domain-containing protein n=1 Tax=Lepisosteus oculatus TaxID=7918 RepID=W5NC55_LEPOC
MQLRAYEIEKRLSTADLFKFPNFETVCWYVGKHLLDTFRGLRENRRHPAAYLVHGAKALNNAFRGWTRKEALPEHEEEIPETIKTQQLVKDLAKEIRLVEDIFQQNLGKTGAPFGAPRALPAQHPPPAPPSRPPGRKRGPKPKEGAPPGATGKKRGRKSKESQAAAGTVGGAGELDLLEIHTKHTLKKTKGKLEIPAACLDDLEGKLNKSKLHLVLTNGKIVGKKGARSGMSPAKFQPLIGQLEDVGGGASDSEDELQIDETPPRRQRAPTLTKRKLAGNKQGGGVNTLTLH